MNNCGKNYGPEIAPPPAATAPACESKRSTMNSTPIIRGCCAKYCALSFSDIAFVTHAHIYINFFI